MEQFNPDLGIFVNDENVLVNSEGEFCDGLGKPVDEPILAPIDLPPDTGSKKKEGNLTFWAFVALCAFVLILSVSFVLHKLEIRELKAEHLSTLSLVAEKSDQIASLSKLAKPQTGIPFEGAPSTDFSGIRFFITSSGQTMLAKDGKKLEADDYFYVVKDDIGVVFAPEPHLIKIVGNSYYQF